MLNFPTDEVESCSSSSNESTWLFSICRKISFPVRDLNGAVLRLIGLVLRRGPDRLVPEVLSGIWRDHFLQGNLNNSNQMAKVSGNGKAEKAADPYSWWEFSWFRFQNFSQLGFSKTDAKC